MAIIECEKRVPRERRKVEYVKVLCLNCQEEFEVPPSWFKSGRRKFCTKDCKNEHQKTVKGKDHPMFGRHHRPESIEKMRQGPRLRGDKHPSWKGGRWMTKGGYVSIARSVLSEEQLAIVAPMLNKAGQILEHRLVVAMDLGRPLTRREKVHHINGNKVDNRPENLQVFPEGGHSRKHRAIDRELSKVKAENKQMRAEIARLKSLLATFQNG